MRAPNKTFINSGWTCRTRTIHIFATNYHGHNIFLYHPLYYFSTQVAGFELTHQYVRPRWVRCRRFCATTIYWSSLEAKGYGPPSAPVWLLGTDRLSSYSIPNTSGYDYKMAFLLRLVSSSTGLSRGTDPKNQERKTVLLLLCHNLMQAKPKYSHPD